MANYQSRASRYAATYELNQFCHTCGADRREYPRAEVKAFPDGTISITGNESHFVEVEPLVFRRVDGSPGTAVFHEDGTGRIDFLAGDAWLVAERIK